MCLSPGFQLWSHACWTTHTKIGSWHTHTLPKWLTCNASLLPMWVLWYCLPPPPPPHHTPLPPNGYPLEFFWGGWKSPFKLLDRSKSVPYNHENRKPWQKMKFKERNDPHFQDSVHTMKHVNSHNCCCAWQSFSCYRPLMQASRSPTMARFSYFSDFFLPRQQKQQ